MDAQSLFRDGVMAVREGKDLSRARDLLLQSLKLNPQNEMAWLWLTETVTDPQKKLECVRRALKINPKSEKALALQTRLLLRITTSSTAQPPPTAPPPKPERQTRSSILPPERPPGAPSDVYSFDAVAAFDTDESEPLRMPNYSADYLSDPEPLSQTYGGDLVDEDSLKRAPTIETALTPLEEKQVARYLASAEVSVERGTPDEFEKAIELWVRVLEIRVDHELALQNAVRYLAKLNYMDDAKELILRAIDAGSRQPSVYVTAVDIAQRLHDHGLATKITEGLLPLKDVDDALILKITDRMVKYGQITDVIPLLEKAVVQRPTSQKLLLRLAELNDELGRKSEAVRYFDRAARVKIGTKEAKQADQALKQFTPIITDRERGSMILALRESLAFPIFFLLLGWLDAGVNLAFMHARWIGVALAFVGGYLIVSAVSSPQQQPLAKWLGGQVPPPKPEKKVVDNYGNPLHVTGALEDPTYLPILPDFARIAFFIVGAVILVFAFYVSFNTAINLLIHPTPFDIPTIDQLLSEGMR